MVAKKKAEKIRMNPVDLKIAGNIIVEGKEVNCCNYRVTGKMAEKMIFSLSPMTGVHPSSFDVAARG